MRGNDLLADGMDAFVLLENVRVNGAVYLGDEIAGIKPRHGRAGIHQHIRADVVDGAAVRDLERPRAVRIPCVILAFDARIGQQRAFFAIQGIDPAQSGGGIFTGGCDGETARPHVAQQIAPAGRAGGIRHEQGFVIRHGGRRHVRVRRHRDEQAADHGCIFIIGGRRERRCAVHRGESVFG